MRTSKVKTVLRDRTYRADYNGDYMDQRQYLTVAASLCFTHICMEIAYIFLGCTPMVLINILSIICYLVSIAFIKSGNTYITIWIMLLEVYAHVICASIFLGFDCGFQLWLFGTLASVFLPFFNPDLSKRQRRIIGTFSIIVIATFMILTFLDEQNAMPTKYYAAPEMAKKIYYVNAFLGFSSIVLYTGIYNARMGMKNRELQMAADHDYLTGIFNRQRMQKILDAEILRQRGMDNTNLSVAIVDIDFFKKINDTYGHIAGDEALKELTNIFRNNAGTGLLYGRWGGEEFLLIAPEEESYNQFAELLENIRKQVEMHWFINGGKRINFTISIGAANYEKGMSAEKLVNLADDRLYKAKETGRNKIVYI